MRHSLAFAAVLALVSLASCDRSPGSARVAWLDPSSSSAGTRDGGVGASRTAEEPSRNRDASTMAEAGFRRYGTPSGIVEYAISGSLKGREVMYFDRWGMREARHTRMDLETVGGVRHRRELTVVDGEVMTKVDLESGTGSRARNPLFDEIARTASTRDLSRAGETLLRSLGGDRVGQGIVLGKECGVWQVPALGGRIWVWRGLPLRTEITSEVGVVLHQATRIELGVHVPDERFRLPDGIRVTGSG